MVNMGFVPGKPLLKKNLPRPLLSPSPTLRNLSRLLLVFSSFSFFFKLHPVFIFLGKSLLAFPSPLAVKENLPISSYGRPILAATPSSFSGSEEEREKIKAKEKGIK